MKWVGILLLLPIVVLLSQQGCSQVGFVITNPVTATPVLQSSAGNGNTYDGKIRVLHHYLNGFNCEGKDRPESVLIRTNDTDWVVIRNRLDKCAYVDLDSVKGVTYDDVVKTATFENKIYVAPRPYYVDPSEDANAPDEKPIDGICADANGKCSLHAAFDTANVVNTTAPVIINVPAGFYSFNEAIGTAMQAGAGHDVSVKGDAAGGTIFDGGQKSRLLTFFITSGVFHLSHVTLQNSVPTITALGSAITSMYSVDGKISISDCIFTGNTGGPSIFTSAPSIEITNSVFTGNSSSFGIIEISFASNLSIVNSTFINSAGAPIWLANDSNLIIDKTYMGENSGGAVIHDCKNGVIQNSTLGGGIYGDAALHIHLVDSDFTILNSTVYGPQAGMTPLIFLGSDDTASALILKNSIAYGSWGVSACGPDQAQSTFRVKATNSLLSDNSCAAVGTGNIFGDPQLSSPAMNGGSTKTMLPANSSPVIDAGDTLNCLPTDQRGYLRPAGLSCDIGAVEAR